MKHEQCVTETFSIFSKLLYSVLFKFRNFSGEYKCWGPYFDKVANLSFGPRKIWESNEVTLLETKICCNVKLHGHAYDVCSKINRNLDVLAKVREQKLLNHSLFKYSAFVCMFCPLFVCLVFARYAGYMLA